MGPHAPDLELQKVAAITASESENAFVEGRDTADPKAAARMLARSS
jgi:hypothetical protein